VIVRDASPRRGGRFVAVATVAVERELLARSIFIALLLARAERLLGAGVSAPTSSRSESCCMCLEKSCM
jgi:hypothetical protein